MKKKFILIVILLFIVDMLLSLPCHDKLVCTGLLADYLAYPGLWFLFLIPISILALSLNDQKHKFWLKFTGIFFVVSMIMVFAMPENAGGMLEFDRELMNWFTFGLYSIISIIYFLVQYFKKD